MTKKNFRLSLAALGLLAVWLIALSTLLLTPTHASADKSLGAKHGFVKKSGAKMGAAPGSTHIGDSNMAKGENGISTATNDRLGPCAGESFSCNGQDGMSDPENSNEHGSGISFANGSRPSNITGDNQKNGGASTFAPGSPGREVPDGIFGNGGTTPFGQNISVQNDLGGSGAANAGTRNAVIGDSGAFDQKSGDGTANNNLPSFGADPTPGAHDDFDPPSLLNNDPALENVPLIILPGVPQPIPEPLTLSLFAVGLAAAAVTRRGMLKRV
jgi:hypothetical protein